MIQYEKPRGALFFNNRKVQGTNQPDYKGRVEFDAELVRNLAEQINGGEKFAKAEISGWAKQSEKAGDFISLSASKPRVKDESASVSVAPMRPAPMAMNRGAVSDDKIPF